MQKVIIKLNERTTIEVAGDDARDVWPIVAFWNSLPGECKVCQSPLILEFKTPKSYKYYVLKCTGEKGGVSHAINLGQKMEGGTLFFDPSKSWEKWNWQPEPENAQAAAASSSTTPPSALSAGTSHPNAPDGERGKLIQSVKRNFDDCRDRNIPGFEKVKLEALGRFTDEQLRNAAAYLKGLLDNPPKKADDDIPF